MSRRQFTVKGGSFTVTFTHSGSHYRCAGWRTLAQAQDAANFLAGIGAPDDYPAGWPRVLFGTDRHAEALVSPGTDPANNPIWLEPDPGAARAAAGRR